MPQDCALRVGDETRQWREGETFVFDDTVTHEAWNYGTSDRVVLLFDFVRPGCEAGRRMNRRPRWPASYDAADEPDHTRALHGPVSSSPSRDPRRLPGVRCSIPWYHARCSAVRGKSGCRIMTVPDIIIV
ncbi:aspartyl/asparaginyl beta-hydroxylase domain-containing protein [Micromonospora zamorensis]|uniref:aspartyl/asparaginyl beta-hydroxylase domain-containing protein n=1 Tax=Micromonospora zamorensis TaxID=709883 RepID=UPI0033AD4A42